VQNKEEGFHLLFLMLKMEYTKKGVCVENILAKKI